MAFDAKLAKVRSEWGGPFAKYLKAGNTLSPETLEGQEGEKEGEKR